MSDSAVEHGDVVWRFSPAATPHARRFVFHPTQAVEDEADGSLLVRFSASGHLEMCWHLCCRGKSVQVLQPARLREMVDGYQRVRGTALGQTLLSFRFLNEAV